jgi:hypothetical protein
MNLEPLAKKLEDMIKQKIEDDGLVNTGTMKDSIKVSVTKDGFAVEGINYFLYLNSEYDILEEVTNSGEFLDFTANYMANEMEKEINQGLNK